MSVRKKERERVGQGRGEKKHFTCSQRAGVEENEWGLGRGVTKTEGLEGKQDV